MAYCPFQVQERLLLQFPAKVRNSKSMDGVFGNGLPEDGVALPEGRLVALGSRACIGYLQEQRSAALSIWSNRKNWVFGFYFGRGDERLWVARRFRTGKAHASKRVLNLAHPLAKGALGLLVFGYAIGLSMACVLTAYATGSRW